MQVFEMPIGSVEPYENNPRHNDNAVDAVAASISEFGWQQPIVIDKNGVIIAGHTRYKAALKLGYVKIPVVKADDLTDEQVRAFRLADNKTAELAEWDELVLAEELADIDGIDMSDFGFEEDEEAPSEEDLDKKDIDISNPITVKIVFKKKADFKKIEQDLREYVDEIDGAAVVVQGGVIGSESDSSEQ